MKINILSNGLKKDINIVLTLAKKSLKHQYRGSLLGYIWTVLNPLLHMLVMWFVFSRIFNYTDPYYPLFLLSGNILFSSFVMATTQGLLSLVNNRNLLLRTKTTLYIFPMSIVFYSIINLALSMVALVPFMIWLSVTQGVVLFTYRLLFLLLMLPALLIFEYGISLFLSILYVFFRDTYHLYSVFVLLWRYATPIFYRLDKVEDTIFMKTMKFNPMYHFINFFRDAVYRGAIGFNEKMEYIGQYNPRWPTLGYLYAFGLISILCAELLYLPLKDKIMVKL